MDEVSIKDDSELDNTDDAIDSNVVLNNNYDHNNGGKMNEVQSNTNKDSTYNLETDSQIHDLVQRTQQFITQLQKDPRYASLL